MGLVALLHVKIFPDQILNCVPCTGRQILNHWTTREVLGTPLDNEEFSFTRTLCSLAVYSVSRQDLGTQYLLTTFG